MGEKNVPEIYIASAIRDLTPVFQDFKFIDILSRSLKSSTHCFLRTENRSWRCMAPKFSFQPKRYISIEFYYVCVRSLR